LASDINKIKIRDKIKIFAPQEKESDFEFLANNFCLYVIMTKD